MRRFRPPKPRHPFIGGRIQEARHELRLKQWQFARRIGVSKIALSNWELGLTYPNPAEICRLAAVTGKPLTFFLGDVGERRTMLMTLDENAGDDSALGVGVALRIRQAHIGRGKSLEVLAYQLDVGVETVARWESNLSQPTLPELRALAEALEVPVCWLFGEPCREHSHQQRTVGKVVDFPKPSAEKVTQRA